MVKSAQEAKESHDDNPPEMVSVPIDHGDVVIGTPQKNYLVFFVLGVPRHESDYCVVMINVNNLSTPVHQAILDRLNLDSSGYTLDDDSRGYQPGRFCIKYDYMDLLRAKRTDYPLPKCGDAILKVRPTQGSGDCIVS